MPKDLPSHKVSEAAALYITGGREDAMTTISSKNQITLPVQLLRELGIGPGDRLAVTREGNRLLLRPRPRDWVAYHAGSLPGLYGRTAAEIEAYVADLRDADEREADQERAWSGHEPASQ